MANLNAPVTNGSHNGQLDLDQERRRWFADYEAIKARFEAEKETVRSRFLQQQRDACTDLDDEARYADLPGLPQKARDLIQKYQGELRSHRWAACQHRFDDEEKDRTRREKDALREHHMVFPVPVFSECGLRLKCGAIGTAFGDGVKPDIAHWTRRTAIRHLGPSFPFELNDEHDLASTSATVPRCYDVFTHYAA
ncbi:uncharacterized protein ColSpa_10294 [Colletotrichum spaethianum]|uniref:Uncharacterized protein n=1 Tax=Colletotrichum spaethianum TaxID=700344 RepID=A0AA37PD98_9PEZI|nr:uncharacterized protein ColSpa_10294 [Colletotrichum spaethianum]GKT50113.1 hypothetical protein ColSpa_10294 [Colletotrichum spaethianum]